ncbi:centrosomal protein of 68 kDa isoform X2 [Tiliqua scincoides]|uniref:centrosomal protein of 68 kDa isoform X2 n=1 Tax=Tiliqua scincoides TaxID=71010 RepID=UPI0034635BB5
MALEVEKSSFEVPLSVKAKCNGRWNYTELDYPDIASKVHQLSDADDEEPLSKGTKDEDSVVVEGSGHTVPALSQKIKKYHKVSLIPSDRFCKIKAKAKYVERQPLISKTTYGHDVPQHFSSTGLHSEKPQFSQLKTVCSNSTEPLQGLLKLPAVLPNRTMDSNLYSPTSKSLHNLDADCNTSWMSFTPYSSTPNHLSGNRTTRIDTSVSIFPKTSNSLQPPEDTEEQQEITRSKSFLATGASAPWYLPSSSDPEENSLLRTHKLIPVDNGSLVGQGRKMSSFQADYWACAIPDSLPPSPDRQSPHWNPNKEYEDLLDYTYPLRPKYKLAKNLKGVVHNSSVHDSGIDLDSLSISPESTLKSVSMQGQEHSAVGILSTQRFSAPLLKKPECSGPVSLCRLSPVGKVSFVDGSPSTGMSREMMHSLSPRNTGTCLSDSTNIGEGGWNTRGHDAPTKSSTPSSFIRSTKVLPLQVCSSDEEYLSLPPRLKELETLAQQLTDLSLTLRKPGHDSVQDRCPCINVNGELFLPEVHGDCGGNESQWDMHYDSSHARSSQENEDLLSNQGFRDHGSMQKETASTDTVETRCLGFLENESHHVIQEKDHYRDSLAQCIKELKKNLADHQALTGSVLQNGERLLKCMTSNSPILQNTLGLIAKQSEELESHAERLYESILAAMDSLGTSLKKCDAQTAAQVESSKWVTPIAVELVSQSLEE